MGINWQDAVSAQDKIAKRGLADAHDRLIGLNGSLLDVYAHLGDAWFFNCDALTKIQGEVQFLASVPTPVPLMMYGHWDEIAPPEARTSDAATERGLRAAADAREHYIDVLQLQANVWDQVAGAYEDAEERISAKAREMIEKAPASWIVKFVELETGVVKLTGSDMMNSLVPALSARAAEAKAIHHNLTDSIEKLKQDVRQFRQGIELQEYKGPQAAPLPKYNWQNPSDLTQQRADDVASIRDEMTNETIAAFAKAANLVEQANEIARDNARTARWVQLTQIVGGVASLGTMLAKAGGNRPPEVSVGNVNLKVPKKDNYMEWYLIFRKNDNVWIDGGATETPEISIQ